MSRVASLALAITVASVSCTNGSEPKGSAVDKPTAPAKTEAVEIPEPVPVAPPASTCASGRVTVSVTQRFDCSADEDCVNSCRWGGVNWRAYKLMEDGCEDGCASVGMYARCIDAKCTAFNHDDTRAKGCNDLPAPDEVCVDKATAEAANKCAAGEKLIGTYARFDCQMDDDCRTSCEYGAVNRIWRERLGAGCKDGCSSKGMHAKCVADRCVTFDREGKAADNCTNRPAPAELCVLL